MKNKQRTSGPQKRYVHETRGSLPLQEGWDRREYINGDDVAAQAMGLYASLGEAGILDAISEIRAQKPNDRMIYGLSNPYMKKEKEIPPTEDDALPEALEEAEE